MNWSVLSKDFIFNNIDSKGLITFLRNYYKNDEERYCKRKFFDDVVKNVFNECDMTKIQLELLYYKLFKKHMNKIILSNYNYERAEHCYIHYINFSVSHVLDIYKETYKEPMPKDYFEDLQYSKCIYKDTFGQTKLSRHRLITLLSDS